MATSAKNWNKDRGEDLPLPSENVARVKRPGPQALLRKGVLPDALSSMVQEMIAKGKGQRFDAKKLTETPENLLAMVDAMDRVLCVVVVEPKVIYHRRQIFDEDGQPKKDGSGQEIWEDIPEEERDEEALYSDEVQFEDKAFIFNYAVGGTRDIARFRRDSGILMGNVSDEQGDKQSTEQPASN